MIPHQHQSSRFSSGFYIRVIALLALAGLITSTYLAVSHYRNFMDIDYQSFCAISRSLNCDTVSQSPYAVFIGVPVAVWGGLGYLFFLMATMLFKPEWKKEPGFALLCVLAILFSMISIILALVSSFWVHSYCIMCMVTYAINFLLMMLAWMAQKRFGIAPFFSNLKLNTAYLLQKKKRLLQCCAVFISLTLAAILFYPKYWVYPTFAETKDIHQGITKDGHPYLGAETPVLTIVEFADYMCFQCGKMHSHLRRLVNEYPDRIRLVHRQFPLDRLINPMVKDTFHEKSSLLSLLALYAAESGKFWQVNDILFREAREKKEFNFEAIAEEAGLDLSGFKPAVDKGGLWAKLSNDVRTGLENGITVTPSYLIDGKLYSGVIPPEVFDPVFNSK